MRYQKYSFKKFIVLIAICLTHTANAAERSWGADYVTYLRLQDYNGYVVVWYGTSQGIITGTWPNSNCTNLVVNSATYDRFWATMTAAKFKNKKMFLYYDDTSCTVNSYGVDVP